MQHQCPTFLMWGFLMWNRPSIWEKGIEVGVGLILKFHLKNLHVQEKGLIQGEENGKIQLNCASPRS